MLYKFFASSAHVVFSKFEIALISYELFIICPHAFVETKTVRITMESHTQDFTNCKETVKGYRLILYQTLIVLQKLVEEAPKVFFGIYMQFINDSLKRHWPYLETIIVVLRYQINFKDISYFHNGQDLLLW